jgi:Lon protease-like protein
MIPAMAALQSSTLPLFPLNTVVFEGGLLPLQIFEPRYLHMVRQCEREGTGFAVVTLTQGREVRGPDDAPEHFKPIGSVMQLVSVQTTQPGVLMVCSRASARCRVQSPRQQADGLWLGEVDVLPAPPSLPIPQELISLRATIIRTLQQLQSHTAPVEPWPEPWLLDDCHWLSCRWGDLLSLPTDMKYRLFALDDPLLRLELIHDLLHPSQPTPPLS